MQATSLTHNVCANFSSSMAKFGEGDKRWIVEDRPDGTNVHNWHWNEKDCLPWSKKRLGELLENITILEGEGGLWVQTTDVESVTGDAYVNIRKGKIIPGYEIAIRAAWKGEAKDGNGNSLAKVSGIFEFPYVADENADEDPEIKVQVKDESPVGQRLREAFLAKGKPVVLKKLAQFVKEFAAGGPAKDELEAKAPAKASEKSEKPKSTAVPATKEVPTTAVRAPQPKVKEGFKTIRLTEKFQCRPHNLYEILMNDRSWKAFTSSNAQISKEVGGMFTIFDGAVTGVNVKLEENKLIVQKWRFNSWADGHYSNVILSFEEPEVGLTVVKLTQTNVPDEDRYGNATVVENTERGWKDLIFHKIRAVFGYGL